MCIPTLVCVNITISTFLFYPLKFSLTIQTTLIILISDVNAFFDCWSNMTVEKANRSYNDSYGYACVCSCARARVYVRVYFYACVYVLFLPFSTLYAISLAIK